MAAARPGVAVGPPDLLLARPSLWKGEPWIVDLLTPTVEETEARFPGDGAALDSAACLERAAILLGGAFVLGGEWQERARRLRNPDLADRLEAAPTVLLPPEAARGLAPLPPGDVLVWGGGAWDWLEPALFVAAAGQAAERTGVSAVVLADRYEGAWRQTPAMRRARPHPSVEVRSDTAQEAFEGIVGKARAWVSLHPAGSAEAKAAFRTRLLDAAATGRPVVVTPGEGLGDLIVDAGGGWHAPEGESELADLLAGVTAEEAARRGALANAAAAALPTSPMPDPDALLPPDRPRVEEEGIYPRLATARGRMARWAWRAATRLAGRR